MADGRTFDVRHPETAALTPGGRLAFLSTGQDEGSIVDLLLMTELQFERMPPAPASGAASEPPETPSFPTS